jgi:hypothetical protein
MTSRQAQGAVVPAPVRLVVPAERDCRISHSHTEQERNIHNLPARAETADTAETVERVDTEERADTAAPATKSAADHMSVQVTAMHSDQVRNAIDALRSEAPTAHRHDRIDEIRERHAGALEHRAHRGEIGCCREVPDRDRCPMIDVMT